MTASPPLAPALATAHPASPGGAARLTRGPVLGALLGALLLLAGGRLLIPFTGDLPLTQSLNTLHAGPAALAVDAVYRALEPVFAVLLTVMLAGLIALRRRDPRVGLRFGLAVALTWLPVGAVKLTVHRPRPTAALLAHPTPVGTLDWSFPSGHVAFVTAVVVAAVLLCHTARSRAVMVGVGVLAVAGIAVVVLVAGLHYPTDVLASIAWGLLAGPLMWEAGGAVAGRLPAQAGVPRR